MTTRNDPWIELQARRRREDQARINSAGQAVTSLTYDMAGVGSIIMPFQPIGTTYVGEPALSTGVTLRNLPPDPARWAESWDLPQITLGVYEYERNTRGFYIGVSVFAQVTVNARSGAANPADLRDLEFVATFQIYGLSYKDLGESVRANLQDSAIAPRTSLI